MFKDLTYKQKVQYLLIGFGVFLLLSYPLALKKTRIARKSCKQTEQKIENIKDAPQKISSIKGKLKSLESIIGKNAFNISNPQELLLENVSSYCVKNAIILKEFPKPFTYQEIDYLVETSAIIIEGNFVKALKLIYSFEQKLQIGRIVSVKFMTVKDYKSKKLKLNTVIYFQNIKLLYDQVNITSDKNN